MLLLWAQMLDLVIIYVPPDNIFRPDDSEAKKGETTHFCYEPESVYLQRPLLCHKNTLILSLHFNKQYNKKDNS